MHELSNAAREVLKAGSVKVRVTRSGMFQQMTFTVRRVRMVNIEYAELFTQRMIDATEIQRVAREFGLPVEAQNGKAFPEGTTASDFQNL